MDVSLFRRDKEYKLLNEILYPWVHNFIPRRFKVGFKVKIISGDVYSRLWISPETGDMAGLKLEEFNPPDEWIPDDRIRQIGKWPGWVPIKNSNMRAKIVDVLRRILLDTGVFPVDGEYVFEDGDLTSQEVFVDDFNAKEVSLDAVETYFKEHPDCEGLVWINPIVSENIRPRVLRDDVLPKGHKTML